MDFKECLENRFSCRDFVDYELSVNELKSIVNLAKLSPSATNMQPSKITFLSKKPLKDLSDILLNAVLNNHPKSLDMQLYPDIWKNPYKQRRFETGVKLYEALGINREDKAKRLEQWHKNYRFFNAKNLAILHIDKDLAVGSFMDAGIFLANFLNAATSLGYATCVLGSVCEYCDEIRKSLDIEDKILCAIALGKASDDRVNGFRTTRVNIDEIARFLGE